MNIALGKGCEKELQVQMKKVGNHFEDFHTSKNLAGFAGQKINIFTGGINTFQSTLF